MDRDGYVGDSTHEHSVGRLPEGRRAWGAPDAVPDQPSMGRASSAPAANGFHSRSASSASISSAARVWEPAAERDAAEAKLWEEKEDDFVLLAEFHHLEGPMVSSPPSQCRRRALG